ncbi:Cysteine synthase B [Shewanella baltica]|nr:Cysteine synthase B [Shewanella baltica]
MGAMNSSQNRYRMSCKPDGSIYVEEQDAKAMARTLAREEGICAGVSSGGAVYAALEIARQYPDSVVVAIVCDRGDRYLSSGLFS